MQITIAIKAPQTFYFSRLVELRQLDIQAATGKNVSLHRLAGYRYHKVRGKAETISIKILACDPGAYFAYELTQAGVTREIAYRLQPLSSQCTSLTYSERVVTTAKQATWRTRWQSWRRKQRLLQETRQVASSYAVLPQLRVAEWQAVMSEES